MAISAFHELPLLIFIILAIYTVYELGKTRKYLEDTYLKNAYTWFMVAGIFFALWGIGHIWHDFAILSKESQLFFHYVVSHGFLLISMSCIAMASKRTQEVYLSLANLKDLKNKNNKK